MNGYIQKCTPGLQKFASNCFLYLVIPQNSVFGPQIKQLFAPSLRLHPQFDYISTHKQVKTSHMNFSYKTFSVYRPSLIFDLKNSGFAVLGFVNYLTLHLPLNPSKTKPSFNKLTSPSKRLGMFFPTQLYPQICSLSFSAFSVGCCSNEEKVICYQLKLKQ